MDWDKDTRITTYYSEKFDVFSFAVLTVVLVAGYVYGKRMFMRKEI